eukprot:6087842-Prorocentrum_lima.AAC.1
MMTAHGTTTRDGRNHKDIGFQGQPSHGESTVDNIQMTTRVCPLQAHEDRDLTLPHGMESHHEAQG